jgi:hypothetical protein
MNRHEYLIFWFVGCTCTTSGSSVWRKEWITTSIFKRQSCGRKLVTKGFLQKTPTSFTDITTGDFCCQCEVIYPWECTVITCMNAAGTYVPLMLIFPQKIMKPELTGGAPPGTISSCDPSGWIQHDIFTEVFQHCLNFAKPTNKSPAVLVPDGHYSHTRNLELIDMAQENHVSLVSSPFTLPTEFSHPMHLSWGHFKPITLSRLPATVSDLMRALSSLARKPGPWVRIPLRAWMFSVCVCVCVFLCLCTGKGLAMS